MVDKRQKIEDEANCADIHKMIPNYNSLTERYLFSFCMHF